MSTQTEEFNNTVQIPKPRYILPQKGKGIIDNFPLT